MIDSSVSFDPSRLHFEPYGLTCVNWRPTHMPRPDYHNEIAIVLLREGFVTYMLGGKKVTVEARKIALFWGAIPHQIIDYSHSEPYLLATVPLHNFLQWRLPESLIQPLLKGKLIIEPENKHADYDIELFERWVDELASGDKHKETLVMLEMQARMTRLGVALVDEAQEVLLFDVPESSLTKVEKMACYIAQNYSQKITVKAVADLVDLHPNYAMTLFHKTFGTTLIAYLTQHRLSHAQRLLTTTRMPITEIAMQSGFQSISRFNDVFSRTFECSPREYRKYHQ